MSKIKAKDNLSFENFKKDIEKRAYELYLERMNKHQSGDDFTDWINAEKEFKVKIKNY